MGLPIQHSARYTTYLKQSIVEALEASFEEYPDPLLRDTKVRLEHSFKEVDYPTIVVNYQETSVRDAGVGHYERVQDPTTHLWYKRRRKHYRGNLTFTISALSSLDRDLIRDAFVETVMMSDVHAYTSFFLLRLYHQEDFERLKDMVEGSIGTAHYYSLINVANQDLSSSGESAIPNPWGAEDTLVYQTTYSMAVFGEVISLPPVVLYNLLSEVRLYPYVGGIESVPTGEDDDAPWIGDSSL